MKIDPHILSKAAQHFDLHVSDLRPLGGMEGMALEFKQGGNSYVLKITPKSKDDPTESRKLEEKLDFIYYLAENGVGVAKPIPSPTGEWVMVVETETQIYLVNALTKAEGKHIEIFDPSQTSPEFFQHWGRVMGQMHALAQTYKSWQKNPTDGSEASIIVNWKDEHNFFTDWCQFDEVRAKWIELGDKIEQLPRNREGYGLIHNDLHPWNFLVDQAGEITVIDFDVCSFHFFAKDVAIPLFFANWSGKPSRGQSKDEYLTDFFHNFMTGYAQENILAPTWYKQLPLFLKHHQILLFTVFTDEWKPYNKWQEDTLKKWERQILNDVPVIKLQF
jgi:Ser/Thr protein kinase RdoA (MazF antagonist)